MAKEQEKVDAETGKKTQNQNEFWDRLGIPGESLPFFNPDENLKKKGFIVQFLTDGPRREAPNKFDTDKTDCWFDIIYFNQTEEGGEEKTLPTKMTWTISQISLLMELKRQAPLRNKLFQIRLVPVDKEWKERYPKYRGTDRYSVTFVEEQDPPTKLYQLQQESVAVEDIEDG